jgi:hypothetical protein
MRRRPASARPLDVPPARIGFECRRRRLRRRVGSKADGQLLAARHVTRHVRVTRSILDLNVAAPSNWTTSHKTQGR